MEGYTEPAEVGGLVDAQTEARAIAQKLQDVVDGTDGWLNVDKAAGIIANALEALSARNERLREALEAIIARSHNDPLGTSKVIDMRRIAERALATGAAHVRVD